MSYLRMLSVASVINQWMVRSVGAIVLNRVRPKFSEKTLLHHKSHIDWPELEPCPPR